MSALLCIVAGGDNCPQEIYGHILEFSTDQYGSRFIQQRLETATEEEKQVSDSFSRGGYAVGIIGSYHNSRRDLDLENALEK